MSQGFIASPTARRPGAHRECRVVDTTFVDKAVVILLAAVWLAMIILVNPIGNYPLNDDWAYGWSVMTLLKQGGFQLSDWTAVNLLSQVIWGALFCIPFGFSFTALRVSTLVLGLVGVLATYALLREMKVKPPVALAGAVTVAVNPLYFCLSNSFMSDVPSFSFTAVAFLFLVRYLTRSSFVFLVGGMAASIVAILNRQAAVIILPAFAVAYVVRNSLDLRRLVQAFLIIVPGVAAYLAYPRWLQETGRTPHLYDYQTKMMVSTLSSSPAEIGDTYAHNLLAVAMYLGVFVLPFYLIVRGFHLQRKDASRLPRIAVLLACFALGLWAAKHTPLPSVGNVIGVLGVGPSAVGAASGLEINTHLLHRVWQLVTIAGVVTAGAVLLMFFKALQAARQNSSRVSASVFVFALLMAMLFVLPVAALPKGYWFDRYLMVPLLPVLLLCTMGTETGSRKGSNVWAVLGCGALGISGAFTVAGTHDYLSWHRGRWQILNSLVGEHHVSPRDIQGGFEFAGWFFGQKIEGCNSSYVDNGSKHSWKDFACLSKSTSALYRVATETQTGYEIGERHTLRRWLPLVDQTYYLLRRKSSTE
jgi:Dolichyl-phosphate-mannose-protein mannosyltransferase